MKLEEVVILADPRGKGYPFAKAVFDNVVNRASREFTLKFVDIDLKPFKDGEKRARALGNLRRRMCFFIHDSNKNPDTWASDLNLVNYAIKFAAADELYDVFPYLKFARQDRKDRSRTSINAKVVADSISKYANRAIAADVHALQIQGFFDIPFDTLYSFPTVVEYLIENHPELMEDLTVMSPDLGGGTRVESFQKKLDLKGIDAKLALGYKRRSRPNEIEKYVFVGEESDVKNRNVLIVDDIIDTGGTLLKATKVLRELGAKKVAAYGTHGLFTGGVKKVTSNLDLVLTSDTIYVEPEEKLETISLVPLMGEAIYKTVRGDSLSELFRVN